MAAPITPEAFAPYGQVVSAGLFEGRSANMGTAVRCDFCAGLESTRPGAKPNLAVFRSTAKSLPFEIVLLEKHPCSTQAFLPMVCTRYLVCVAPALPDGTPDIEGLVAFQCGPGQGINYRRDVWHHPILALDGDADFAMLAWEDGSAVDCVEHPLVTLVRVIG
ncbi:MAG: ureidoglycolate lyase [Polyangiaceae bacterium]